MKMSLTLICSHFTRLDENSWSCHTSTYTCGDGHLTIDHSPELCFIHCFSECTPLHSACGLVALFLTYLGTCIRFCENMGYLLAQHAGFVAFPCLYLLIPYFCISKFSIVFFSSWPPQKSTKHHRGENRFLLKRLSPSRGEFFASDLSISQC